MFNLIAEASRTKIRMINLVTEALRAEGSTDYRAAAAGRWKIAKRTPLRANGPTDSLLFEMFVEPSQDSACVEAADGQRPTAVAPKTVSIGDGTWD